MLLVVICDLQIHKSQIALKILISECYLCIAQKECIFGAAISDHNTWQVREASMCLLSSFQEK